VGVSGFTKNEGNSSVHHPGKEKRVLIDQRTALRKVTVMDVACGARLSSLGWEENLDRRTIAKIHQCY
jgi:hypothetical protein